MIILLALRLDAMNITLKETKVDYLSLSACDNEEPDDNLSFSYSCAFSQEESKKFLIIFDMKLFSKDEYSLELRYIASFETSKVIEDEKKNLHFFDVNAPAIAYPYLRAYISTILLNSGWQPAILPTVNFVALAKEMKKENTPQLSIDSE